MHQVILQYRFLAIYFFLFSWCDLPLLFFSFCLPLLSLFVFSLQLFVVPLCAFLEGEEEEKPDDRAQTAFYGRPLLFLFCSVVSYFFIRLEGWPGGPSRLVIPFFFFPERVEAVVVFLVRKDEKGGRQRRRRKWISSCERRRRRSKGHWRIPKRGRSTLHRHNAERRWS